MKQPFERIDDLELLVSKLLGVKNIEEALDKHKKDKEAEQAPDPYYAGKAGGIGPSGPAGSTPSHTSSAYPQKESKK